MVDSVTDVLVWAYVTVRYHATFPLTNEIICYKICHLVRYDLEGCKLNDLRNTVYNVRLLLTKTA
jgi:phage gp36-like protein